MDDTLKQFISLANQHRGQWLDKPSEYWLARLQEEVLELGLALRNQHEHTPEQELMEIGTMALNLLHKRKQEAINE